MEQSDEKRNRSRRSKLTLQRDILDAIARIVQKQGFFNINLSLISQESGVDINTIIRNFGTIEKILEQYVHIYDYWVGSLLDEFNEDSDPEVFYETTLMKFIDFVYKNKEMQMLLVWELAENNHITNNTAQKREVLNEKLIHHYNVLFEEAQIPIDAVTGLLIAGIYYLILHRKRSTFFGIDYSTRNGKKKLMDTVSFLTKVYFDTLKKMDKEIEIIRRLKEKNVPPETIAHSTGYTIEQIKEI